MPDPPSPPDDSIAGALDNLVNQFTDPLAFLRELVQNALDADSAEIDVWMTLRASPDDPERGVMTIGVDDDGHGMDRAIIDGQLTRLFSSAKAGDMTRIGKFGIGFVSVFAIAPDAVCVDTSRNNEDWRVLFGADRAYRLIRRDERVEGTRIQVIKSIARDAYDDHERRALKTLRFWCKHIEVAELRFQGSPVNEPFALDAPVTAAHHEPDTRVIVALSDDPKGFFGFYNKGLTLLEGRGHHLPHVAFKVDSRYLEHTLSRDDVVHDANHRKAMQIVERLARGPLIDALFAAHEDALEADDRRALLRLRAHLVRLLHANTPISAAAARRPLVRRLDDATCSLEAARAAARKHLLYACDAATPLTTRLAAEGALLVRADAPLLTPLLTAASASPRRPGDRACVAPPITDPARLDAWQPLAIALTALLDAHGARLRGVSIAALDFHGSPVAGRVAITQAHPDELTPLEDTARLGTSIFSRRRLLVVNADHPTVSLLTRQALHEPELAAYTLTKLFFLNDRLDPALDARLAALTAQRRLARLNPSP